MNIEEFNVKTKTDFIEFVHLLLKDLKDNPEKWENKTLPDYLEAIIAWTEDMEGYYINNDLRIPTDVSWSVMADILQAASVYE